LGCGKTKASSDLTLQLLDMLPRSLNGEIAGEISLLRVNQQQAHLMLVQVAEYKWTVLYKVWTQVWTMGHLWPPGGAMVRRSVSRIWTGRWATTPSRHSHTHSIHGKNVIKASMHGHTHTLSISPLVQNKIIHLESLNHSGYK